MRGQVLKADSVEGLGLILGDDGVRYNFSQAQVRDNNRLVQGHVVDFVGMGDEARDIYLLQATGQPSTQPVPPQPVRQGMRGCTYAQPMAVKSDGIWTYFLRCLSSSYFKFNGRARRQEYWGYILFSILALILAFVVDTILTLSIFGVDDSEDTFSLSSPRFGYFIPSFRV